MSRATKISEEEYLASTYEPDCDYVEGRLVERNLGEFDHSRLQTLWRFCRAASKNRAADGC